MWIEPVAAAAICKAKVGMGILEEKNESLARQTSHSLSM